MKKQVIKIIDILVALMFMTWAIDGYCMGNEVQMYASLILATLYLLKLDLDERDV